MTVYAGKPDGVPAVHLQQVGKGFVDFTGQDHLYNVHGLFIGDPQAVYKFRFFPQPFHQVVDLRPAPVHQHDFNAYMPEQHDVFHDLQLQGFVNHGVAAVFDHDDFPIVLFNIWQRLHQNLGALRV